MYEFTQLMNGYTNFLVSAVASVNNSLKHTLLYNPSVDALSKSVQAFTPSLEKPDWAIEKHETKVILDMESCEITKFVSEGSSDKPNILVVAPISGHYATLLSDTVRRLTKDYTVYITDWKNVRDNPKIKNYGMEQYVTALSEAFKAIQGGTHVLAVCQGCVPSLMALCTMEHSHVKSITLMAGPIDTRVGSTGINDFCKGKSLAWFNDNLIQTVSREFSSSGAKVYPGTTQLANFMSMNLKSHQDKFMEMFFASLAGDTKSQARIGSFYNEYTAVMDIPAPFYLDMIKDIFLDQKLVKGLATHNDKLLSLKSVKCPVLVIEGENDDICGKGQTLAVMDYLMPTVGVEYHLQENVGHYGCFSGSLWNEQIAPAIIEFHNSSLSACAA